MNKIVVFSTFLGAFCQPLYASSLCRTDLIRQTLNGPGQERTLVVAHRGAHDRVPENSLAAIERAIELGASVVELDIRRTQDGKYVLMHDETLDRTTNGTGATADFPLAALQELRLLDNQGRPTELTVPTLTEALDTAKDRILLMLDAKVDEANDIAAMADLVKQRKMQGQMVLYDFNQVTLAAYRQQMPDALTLVRSKQADNIDSYVKQYQPDIFHIEISYNNAELGEKFDQLGVPTWLNLINKNKVDRAIAKGDFAPLQTQVSYRPDLVQTDYPAQVIAFLKAQGLHPAVLSQPEVKSCTR